VNQLHGFYRAEIEKVQAEKNEIESRAMSGLEELKAKLRGFED